MTDLSQHNLELTYPCEWKYKLIASNEKDIKDAVKSVIMEREYKLTLSNTSKKGKFVSYSLKTLVHNEDDRVEIYRQLTEHTKLIRVL